MSPVANVPTLDIAEEEISIPVTSYVSQDSSGERVFEDETPHPVAVDSPFKETTKVSSIAAFEGGTESDVPMKTQNDASSFICNEAISSGKTYYFPEFHACKLVNF